MLPYCFIKRISIKGTGDIQLNAGYVAGASFRNSIEYLMKGCLRLDIYHSGL